MFGVVGGSGGVGASTFAAVLAAVIGDAMLLDLDVMGGGIDVLLGIEGVPGARWSGLRVGSGRLDPGLLADGVPRWGAVPVLAADATPDSAEAVAQVLGAASSFGPVVVDLGRSPNAQRAAALSRCAFVVLLAAAQVCGLTAARAVAHSLTGTPTGLVLRRGPVAPSVAAPMTGTALVAVVPALSAPRERGIDARRPPRALARAAAGVLEGVLR